MKRRGYRISALGSALRSRGVALGRAIPPSDAPVGVPVTGHGTVVSTAPRLRHDATAPPEQAHTRCFPDAVADIMQHRNYCDWYQVVATQRYWVPIRGVWLVQPIEICCRTLEYPDSLTQINHQRTRSTYSRNALHYWMIRGQFVTVTRSKRWRRNPLAIGWSIPESSAQLGPSWSDSSLPIT